MPRGKTLKPIPTFASETEEREFWANADVLDYFEFAEEDGDLAPPTNSREQAATKPAKARKRRAG